MDRCHPVAFLTKLAWGLITRPDALWVKLLRAKYLTGDRLIPQVHVWRGIGAAWPTVLGGIGWIFGDGTSVDFWRDPWMPGLSPLDGVPGVVNPDAFQGAVLADMVVPNGGWRFRYMGGIGFRLVHSEGLLRARAFLQQLGHDALMTNLERQRRHLGSDPSCGRCLLMPESALHALRDCLVVKGMILEMGNDRVYNGGDVEMLESPPFVILSALTCKKIVIGMLVQDELMSILDLANLGLGSCGVCLFGLISENNLTCLCKC
ncbi:hypothetical protein Tsubulata_028603 [Turnera subulata]|uniref:Reverse transcriptase zinc-binding domain-containing protein n=1 Tax=Turnera subulata TaxID=218843 RepID=A0A9Q0G137_9ROSI|nr:hypothetical protein Tsubulata_028603 [Turnera subulata]